MIIYPASMEAENIRAARAYATWQGASMSCRERQEQARRAFSAGALKRDQRNVKTSVVLEAKALGGRRS
jgi:hypothetical protein